MCLVLQVLAAQCTALVGIVEALRQKETQDKPISAFSDAILDATNMSVHSFAYLSQARRENLINEFGNPLATLCKAKQPVGATTLLDCSDVLKKLKVKKLFKKSKFTPR
jgi:hypothetical protein